MNFTVCSISEKTGKITDVGETYEDLDGAQDELDLLNEARGNLPYSTNFRWGVFKLTEIDMSQHPRMPKVLYELGDVVSIHGATAVVGSTTITPSGVRYLVRFPNGDLVKMDQKNIEGLA